MDKEAKFPFKVFKDLNFGEIHIKEDKNTGMFAIIAIHSTFRGPALGGCRFVPYSSVDAAIIDALRLAQGMSYKAAISNLALGGGKAVLIHPEVVKNRKALFESFGKFVNELGGRYITAEDSGTNVADMDIIRVQTPYVVGDKDDPSPHTSFGVRRGIEAAVKFKLKKDSLENIHVAIQGVGKVGYYLAKELHALGAKLTICDINVDAINLCQKEFGANVANINEIHKIKCDVFAPCALGSSINPQTIEEIQAPIIAGGANNQLSSKELGPILWQKGILYAPDFAINAGGLIHVMAQYAKYNDDIAHKQIENIFHTMLEIFDKATSENTSTEQIANKMALERLKNK